MKIWPIKRLYRIPLIYGVFSILWIFFTDKISFALSPNLQQAVIYSTLKGLLFVVSSTLLIFFLLKSNESHKEHLLNEMAAVQRSFNLLFENNPQPMWIYDNKTLEIMAVNPAACRIYGYSADEFRKLKITDLRKEDEIPTLLKTLSDYKDELRQSGPWEHLKKGGEPLIVKVISHPLRSTGFDSTLVSIIDLTEQEKTKDELFTTKQERDDYESFGYTASHDLKSHLRAIIGYSDILQQEYKKQLDEEGLKCVHQIHKAGMTMNQILDDMLVLTGISRKPLQYQKVNLSELYDETVKMLRQSEPERQVVVTIQQDMSALADRGAVRIITQNLFQNAWKYTKKSPNARIEIGSFENSEAETVFYVKDNGLGIDPSYTKLIFEPFKRAHGNSIAEGMGIGLSIVRRAVERHEGRVWVESEPGKGSCFYFTLRQKDLISEK